MTDLLIPLTAALIISAAVIKGTPFAESFAEGAKDGLRIIIKILPVLILVVSASAMLRVSGFIEWLAALLAPVLAPLGVPAETVPLALLRPLSGGASLAYMSEIVAKCGPDSREGLIAAIMTASTETTLYTVSLYSAGKNVKKLPAAVAAALLADLVSFACAVFYVNIFLSV